MCSLCDIEHLNVPENPAGHDRFGLSVGIRSAEGDATDYAIMLDRERFGRSIYIGATPADWWLSGYATHA